MNYIDRMKVELAELQNRYSKLENFYNDNFNKLDYAKRIMMKKQKDIMYEYINILIVRLKMEGVTIE